MRFGRGSTRFSAGIMKFQGASPEKRLVAESKSAEIEALLQAPTTSVYLGATLVVVKLGRAKFSDVKSSEKISSNQVTSE